MLLVIYYITTVPVPVLVPVPVPVLIELLIMGQFCKFM